MIVSAMVCAGCTAEQSPSMTSTDGTTAVELPTHCGIRYLRIGDDWFERLDGPLAEDGNPPSGWRNPAQPGRVVRTGDLATFTDDAGHRESFEKMAQPPSSATNCA
ncbi:hypothetical protein [Terrabacter sp. NPDC080008]|uniref:hypothetical protein n=1 Tax=Terrabacter sp. NPDC080008 TaxID=3155176 RepID=UPI00344CD353